MRGDSARAEYKLPEPPTTSQPTSDRLSAERESNPIEVGENGSPSMRPEWPGTSAITTPPENKTKSPEHDNQLLQSIKRSLIIAKQSAQQKVAARVASRKATQRARELEKLRSALIISFPSNREEQTRPKTEEETKRRAAEARSHEAAQARIRAEQEHQAEQARLKAEEETRRRAAEARSYEEAQARIRAEQEREAEQSRQGAQTRRRSTGQNQSGGGMSGGTSAIKNRGRENSKSRRSAQERRSAGQN